MLSVPFTGEEGWISGFLHHCAEVRLLRRHVPTRDGHKDLPFSVDAVVALPEFSR
jgi:hypothetical protein